jgi:uncharacterized DUF497 family protein
MIFEFDAAKSRENLVKHGIDFILAQRLWEVAHVVIPAKGVVGENRSAILGKLLGKVYMAIFTLREEKIRIISCHRADKKWEKVYESLIRKKA